MVHSKSAELNMAKKKINKQLLNIGFLVILIAITVIVIFTANDISFSDIFAFLKTCDARWIVGAVGLMIASVLFESISLHFIMRGLGERPNFYRSTCYTSADLYYSAITPSGTGGQPASIYYMAKDGIGAGKATFGLIFNLTAYTLSIIIIGAVAFIVRPGFFAAVGEWFPQLLIVVGCIIQGLLLAFFIGCMFWGGAVKKAGNGIISLLHKIHIIKKPEKWRDKLAAEIELYKDCLYEIKNHPGMSVINVLANLGQRICHVLIPVFVILAAQPEANFWDLCVCSALIIIGYNSIPLPGGMGVYEYLYVRVYSAAGLAGGSTFILSALMVSRFISFYMIMVGCGLYTLAYHIQVMRRPSAEVAAADAEEQADAEGEGSSAQEDTPDTPAADAEEQADAEREGSSAQEDTPDTPAADENTKERENTKTGEEYGREQETRGDGEA